MKIYLIRHGESTKSGLTEQGKNQANWAGIVMKGLKFKKDEVRFFTSPSERAVQSAAIIAEVAGLPEAKDAAWLSGDAGLGDIVKGLFYVLNKKEPIRAIVLVSHDPVLGVFLSVYGEKAHLNNCDVYELDMDKDTVRKISP